MTFVVNEETWSKVVVYLHGDVLLTPRDLLSALNETRLAPGREDVRGKKNSVIYGAQRWFSEDAVAPELRSS